MAINPIEQFFADKSVPNQPYIDDLYKIKQHTETEPDFIPRKFIDQIQFFDDGEDVKVYFYINGSWKSITLT
jgi:hypothetical protein